MNWPALHKPSLGEAQAWSERGGPEGGLQEAGAWKSGQCDWAVGPQMHQAALGVPEWGKICWGQGRMDTPYFWDERG